MRNAQVIMKDGAILFVGAILGFCPVFVNQYFMRQISEEFLRFYLIILYVPILFEVIGRIFGQSLLVVLPQETSIQIRKHYINGSVISLFLVLCSLSLALGPLLSFFQFMAEAPSLEAVRTFYYLQLLSAVLSGVTTLFSFTLVSLGFLEQVIRANGYGLMAHILASSLLFLFIEEISWRVMGMGIIAVASALLTVWLKIKALSLPLWIDRQTLWAHCKQYLARTRAFLTGETLSVLLITGTPFAIAFVLRFCGSGNLCALYNISNRLMHFILLSVFVIMSVGTRELAQKLKNPRAFQECFVAILSDSFLTIALLMFIFLYFSREIFSVLYLIEDPSAVLNAMIILLGGNSFFSFKRKLQRITGM